MTNPYPLLITAEHADKPNFVAVVTALTQGLVDYRTSGPILVGGPLDSSIDGSVDDPADAFVDASVHDATTDPTEPIVFTGQSLYTFGSLPGLFDLDIAFGAQLDATGEWIGLTRSVNLPGYGTVSLDDLDYRTLLRAKIAINHWDGSLGSLQIILANIFPNSGIKLVAVDNYDMTMSVYVLGGTLSALQLAMLQGDYLVPRPEGVLLNGIATVSGPLFGLDAETAVISGLDVGAFSAFV